MSLTRHKEVAFRLRIGVIVVGRDRRNLMLRYPEMRNCIVKNQFFKLKVAQTHLVAPIT